ncbi:hypothetical protein [Maribacter halichondriae]|uniref:hypothetical protein n=1 Tax=Maribacter halichondriae TaxID=2980554 RepID=UPI002359A0F4|nr:hypothetical protein [Maribacter sp. Hal144]
MLIQLKGLSYKPIKNYFFFVGAFLATAFLGAAFFLAAALGAAFFAVAMIEMFRISIKLSFFSCV